MASNAAEFIIRLNQQVSGPANAATGALNRLEAQIRKEQGALAEAEGAMKKFIASGNGSIAQHDALAAKIAKSKDAIQQLNGALGGFQSRKAAADLEDFNKKQQEFIKGGDQGTVSLGAVSDALGKLGPQAQAASLAIKIATIAVTAFFGAIAAGMAMAITVGETLAHMRAQFNALAGGAAAGGQVAAMVDKLGQKLPFATAQVAEWAKGLLAVGIRGKELESRVKAVAAATAVMGEGGGAAAEKLFRRLAEGDQAARMMLKTIQSGGPKAAEILAETGITTKDIAAQLGMTEKAFKTAHISAAKMAEATAKVLQAKGAGELARQMNSWPNILQKAKEGAMSLFAGVKTEAFMAGVAKIFGLFNKGGLAIQALKPIVTSVFGTLFTWATKALGWAYEGFLRLAIVAVKAYIMAHPLIGAFREMWAAIVKLGAALGIVSGKSTGLAILTVIGRAIAGAFQSVIMVILGLAKVVTFVANIGTNVSNALAKGITAGGGAVVAAIKGLASTALGAFTSAFQIHSPSRIMLKHGDENIAGALAGGVDAGAPKVERSMAKLGGKPGGARGVGQASGGGDNYFDFRGAHFGGDLDEGKIERIFVRILQAARRAVPEMEPAPT